MPGRWRNAAPLPFEGVRPASDRGVPGPCGDAAEGALLVDGPRRGGGVAGNGEAPHPSRRAEELDATGLEGRRTSDLGPAIVQSCTNGSWTSVKKGKERWLRDETIGSREAFGRR